MFEWVCLFMKAEGVDRSGGSSLIMQRCVCREFRFLWGLVGGCIYVLDCK